MPLADKITRSMRQIRKQRPRRRDFHTVCQRGRVIDVP
jgi:hypothetical protein